MTRNTRSLPWVRYIIPILPFIMHAHSVAIDNSVIGSPVVNCGNNYIGLTFQTSNPFAGRIFIKGYAYQADCGKGGSGTNQDSFQITFNQCGLNGIGISTTVIVSFHNLFLTKVDRAYRINCFYMEATKTVTQVIDVSMLTTQDISNNVPMPICRYDILQGSAQGPPVRFARIGDPVFHKWTCDAEVANQFCIRVHSCTVSDGQGGQTIQILDRDGCSIDPYVLQNLEYTSDLMAGQEAHVFKFADRPALYFNCQIEIKLKNAGQGCAAVRPVCAGGVPGSSGYGSPPTSPVVDPYGSGTPVVVAPQQVYSVQPPVTAIPYGTPAPIGGGAPYVSGPVAPVQPAYPAPSPILPLPTAPYGGQTQTQPYLQKLRQSLRAKQRSKRDADVITVNQSASMLDNRILRDSPLVDERETERNHNTVAMFDLPEKRITVFDLDAILGDNLSSHHNILFADDPDDDADDADHANRVLDLLTRRRTNAEDTLLALGMSLDEMVCMQNDRFIGYALALVAVSVMSVAVLAIIFVRRKTIFGNVHKESA